MSPRLKVFQWSDGFHAFTVAATSRPRALEAWGVSQDLFATGLAKEIHDGPDIDPARDKPGVVIERGLSVDVGKAVPRPAARRDANRRKRDEAVAALEKWTREAEAEAARLDDRIADLEREREALRNRHAAERRRLEARVDALRRP